MADKLLLEDVRFYGQHGLTRAEQVVGAWFSVDVELAVDLSSAMVSDQVAATVDYGLVAKHAKTIVDSRNALKSRRTRGVFRL